MILFALTTATAVLGASAAPPSFSGNAATSAGGATVVADSATVAADPASVNAVLAAATPGMTIRLVAGSYPAVVVRSRTFIPPITIDATGSTLAGIQVYNTTGVRWTGGTVRQPQPAANGTGLGVLVSQAQQITIDGVRVSDFRIGIVFDRVAGGTISGNWLARMGSDGIDLILSRSITVTRNACSDFAVPNGAHPDCIQAWSRPGAPPVADLEITGNTTTGAMQGISLFNHVRDGVDDGGFDRVTISGNSVLTTFGDGISVYSCRGCKVRNNYVNSLPNYMHAAQLTIWGGSVEQCGNVVPMVKREGTPPCTN